MRLLLSYEELEKRKKIILPRDRYGKKGFTDFLAWHSGYFVILINF